MAESDLAGGHALCARKADIIHVHLVHHVTPHPHCVGGYAAEGEADYRQDAALPIERVEQHRQFQQSGKIQLYRKEVNCGRQRVYKQNVCIAQRIHKFALAARHQHAKGVTYQHLYAKGYDAELEGSLSLGPNNVNAGYAFAHDDGLAKITFKQQLAPEIIKLLIPRVQQTQLFQYCVFYGFAHGIRTAFKVTVNGQQSHEQEYDG